MATMEYILHTKDYQKFELRAVEEFVEPIEFDDANYANGCFVGDRVTWDAFNGCRLVERADHPVLAGILELKGKVKYGVTSRGIPLYLFQPHRREYPNIVVGCSESVLTHNKLALVRVDEMTPSGRSLPRGTLEKILGNCGDARVERLALLWAYTPFVMPDELSSLKPERSQKRREYELRPSTPENTFHIDPPECKDVDDVISIDKAENGNWRVWITISDVAEWIDPRSNLDNFAKNAGATTYENGVPIRPMLPQAYSEGVCSLLPGEKGLGISLIMEWDGKELGDLMFLKTVVNVKRSYTYEQANAETTTTFRVLKDITTLLMGHENPDSHQIIEALMILYNREVATLLRKKEVGILRRHDASDIAKWDKFQSMAPECMPLAFKAASYCTVEHQDVYHSGLGVSAYCTATSPIRRYADLVNQRILKCFLGMSNQDIIYPDVTVAHLNKRQKELKQYERDLFFITNMFPNERRVIQGVILDWKPLGDTRIAFHVYIPTWKRILTWRTTGKIVDNRVKCVLFHKQVASETYLEELMVLKFEIYWNPQGRYWKDKLILRLA